jgi:hypothetical protein
MNCQDYELLVLRLARERLLEAAARDRARAHAEACARCAARLAEERALLVGVRLVNVEIAKEGAPSRLEAELLRAFREHAAVTPVPDTGAPPAVNRPVPRRALAVAAVILISITAASTLRQMSGSPERREGAQSITSVPSVPTDRPHEPSAPQPNPLINDERKLARGRVGNVRVRPARRRPGPLDTREAEVATHFFPLPDADDFNSLESGQVVRLELPGSALEEMGLPFDVVTAGKTVTADVVVGPDGVARAIRFIP